MWPRPPAVKARATACASLTADGALSRTAGVLPTAGVLALATCKRDRKAPLAWWLGIYGYQLKSLCCFLQTFRRHWPIGGRGKHRFHGLSFVARLGRESLYKALSPGGNPEFATVLKVMRALGLRLHASSAAAP